MAGSAGGIAEDGVGAGGERLGFVRVASGALHFGDFGGMREIFDGGVTVFAAESTVGAGGMPGRIDRNALPGVGLHSRLAMARQTFLVCGGRQRSRSQSQCQVSQSNASREHFNTLLFNSTASRL